jgi:hypothetical protein
VARPRHKHVKQRPLHQRLLRMGLPPLAVLAIGSPAIAAVWAGGETPAEVLPMTTAAPVLVRTSPVPMRVAPISRSAPRVELEEKPPEAVGHKFAAAPLNIRSAPSKSARLVEVLERGQRFPVTGRERGQWLEVLIDGELRWVHSAYVADRKPKPEPKPEPEPSPAAEQTPAPEPTPAAAPTQEPAAPAGLSTAPCATGSGVESGLAPNAVAVHRAVCAAFPSVTSYGGVRPGDSGAHGSGNALDIMVSGSSGDEIAAWVRANASALGVSEVIWAQKIWTVQRSSEGWRPMEDRGSTTANHYDHVHVTVY